MEIVHAPDVISMHDEPTSILRAKKDCSMAVAFRLLADGEADAFVSAGSTGAVVVGGTLIVKRIKGVKRVALASMIPGLKAPFLMLDIGANADTRPEMLAQYGLMASVYLEKVEGRENPTVGLLNIGTEETKGDELHLAAYDLLQKAPINFIGNIESREIMKGECDAVVTDGFTGNIALKSIEGTAKQMARMIKDCIKSSVLAKIGALFMIPAMMKLKKTMDPRQYNGAMFVGLNGLSVKSHGGADAFSFSKAVENASNLVRNDFVSTIRNEIEKVDLDELQAVLYDVY
jgi:glycerol-3-phosphate acyltransferase PlsX